MKFLDNKTIAIDKELNELDKFVLGFLEIAEKHARYAVASGYVPILFGRARATEDVDIFIEELPKKEFAAFLSDLEKHGWICMNTNNEDEMFSFLEDNMAIRFHKKDSAIPNIEIKFAKKKFDRHTLEDRLKVVMQGKIVFVPSMEEQIAYKKTVLGSDKDMEDARHLEELFKDRIDRNKLERLEKSLRSGDYEF